MSLPQGKMNHIMNHSAKVIHKQTVSVRELASLIGKMTASMAAVVPAPLQCRFLQMAKTKALINQNSYEAKVTLTSGCKEELQWWIEHLRDNNGKTLITPFPDMTIESDASLMGWGATCQGKRTGGAWSSAEKSMHINALELTAAFLAIKTFTKGKTNIHVHLKMDNRAAVAHVIRMGGTKSPTLVNLSKEMWQYSLAHKIYLTAEYLPGVNNVIADWESRHVTDSSDWQLDPQIFKLINKQMGNLEVDLFASRINHQLEKYISWRPDPGAMATDALQISWGHMKGYAFPPFTLIARCLSKIRKEQSTIVMITPTWHTQPWFPLIMEMSIDFPILLPTFKGLLISPLQQVHPLLETGSLQLAAWRVSGNHLLQMEFQKKLPNLCHTHGVTEHQALITPPGENGVVGVVNNKLIHFRPLWAIS
ncbi:uncharacterized protein [Ptychodera flava]|uniref:uncharacterized protein n=1 Tax=Ptychodera flava TaxID=63121 RepID=UPI00396A463E